MSGLNFGMSREWSRSQKPPPSGSTSGLLGLFKRIFFQPEPPKGRVLDPRRPLNASRDLVQRHTRR